MKVDGQQRGKSSTADGGSPSKDDSGALAGRARSPSPPGEGAEPQLSPPASCGPKRRAAFCPQGRPGALRKGLGARGRGEIRAGTSPGCRLSLCPADLQPGLPLPGIMAKPGSILLPSRGLRPLCRSLFLGLTSIFSLYLLLLRVWGYYCALTPGPSHRPTSPAL